MPALECDVLVVGGGINGAGIARDLAGRGSSVVLAEKDDLAAHTSSSSTKLIHGGLRYLEYYEFSLVRKALGEREVLLRSAPHIMRPLRFVMPHDPGMRPVWMIRIGLFLYDHLARRDLLPASTTVNLRNHPAGVPLQKRFTRGFVYSDGWVDDARLVVLNAIDAAERGARIFTRTACVDARRGTTHWQAVLQAFDGTRHHVKARALVNAAGPWAAQFLTEHAHTPHVKALRLVKGSHIVVPRLFEHDHAYLFQNPDGRIIFAIPYEDDFTLIGTTDVEHHGAIGAAHIDAGEIAYLCEEASRYLERAVTPADVVWSYSGVRPLLDDESGDPAAVTRDYELELDTTLPAGSANPAGPGAPLLSVWGGKITTSRKLAEEAADLLARPLRISRGAWTEHALLPGGDLSASAEASSTSDASPRSGPRTRIDIERFAQALAPAHPQWPAPVLRRLAHAYGSRVHALLAMPRGAEVAPGLFESELEYLHRDEWARNADDVLWRRSKLGLHYSAAQRAAVAEWCRSHWPTDAAAVPPAEPAWN
ncbi:MAG TPA: glycerol-3-phosphate dehydrogenase [Burkholderiaceae bacterium]|nr:glycerol-3-phosphate dehydrogenase [Burkholderiaceae bacterium]